MSKNCVKLLCEDPVFAEYIKCILMDERTFLNNNIVYTFLTHFLLKVRGVLAIIITPRNECRHWCCFILGCCFHSCDFLWLLKNYFVSTGARAGIFWSKLCQPNQHSNYKSNKSVSKPRIWLQQPESWNFQSQLYIKWGESFLTNRRQLILYRNSSVRCARC